jgi:hypothetical protein
MVVSRFEGDIVMQTHCLNTVSSRMINAKGSCFLPCYLMHIFLRLLGGQLRRIVMDRDLLTDLLMLIYRMHTCGRDTRI